VHAILVSIDEARSCMQKGSLVLVGVPKHQETQRGKKAPNRDRTGDFRICNPALYH
jgi:hypothetical protein